jgi:UDPglucose--hexose-1-phosphate uridylyltransferase
VEVFDMSELRLNILNGNWTVISPERGNKPESFRVERTCDIRALERYDAKCPFCPGNESDFDIDLLHEIYGDNGEWQARLIENKYKIFDNYANCPVVPEKFDSHGVHFLYKGCGNHYLVLEHPEHNRVMGLMTSEEIFSVFSLYLEAVSRLSGNPNNLIHIIFKNQGAIAGASQPHAHSQVVGSRVVPAWIRHAMQTQQRYFDQHGICAMCAMLEFEWQYEQRIIMETEHTIVLSPYAAAAPYEMWIIPKRHFACFSEINDSEIKSLAESVRMVLRNYIEILDNPDFNYFFHSAPHPLAGVPFYHMFIQIIPRLWNSGGFETGTGIAVNSVSPEEMKNVFKLNI